jgi:hemoglobin
VDFQLRPAAAALSALLALVLIWRNRASSRASFNKPGISLMTSAQEPAFGVGDASFQAAGGESGLQRLVADFYQVMEEAPQAAIVRAMYPDDVSAARDRLASFLSGWLGGPKRYAEKYGGISIPQFHTRWQVGEAEHDAWLFCMEQAIARQPYTPEFAEYLLRQLRVPAERIRQAQAAWPARPGQS